MMVMMLMTHEIRKQLYWGLAMCLSIQIRGNAPKEGSPGTHPPNPCQQGQMNAKAEGNQSCQNVKTHLRQGQDPFLIPSSNTSSHQFVIPNYL